MKGIGLRRAAAGMGLAAGLMLCLWTASGCGRAAELPEPTETPRPRATVLPEAEPVPAHEPAPQPPLAGTPSPSPLPSPKINDEWYLQRRQEMEEQLRSFGGPLSEEEIQRILLSREIDPDRPMIALTFDDGPVAAVTNGVLDVLEAYNVRATFFICGYRLFREENAACLPRMLRLGCEIGNHTFEHDDLTELDEGLRRKTIRKANDMIEKATGGYVPRSLRPPGGKTNGYIKGDGKKFGMAVVLWSQSGNVHLTDPRAIADNVQKQAVDGRELRHGDIVLLHDTKERMVEAVELMVPELLEQGYQLVTVQELLSLSEAGFVPGLRYRSMLDYK